MRKIFCLLVLILMTGMILAGTDNTAAGSTPARIILYTYYRQMGWGDRVQIGCVDEEGVLRTITGYDSSLKWPYKPEEQLEYLSQTDQFETEYAMKYTDFFAAQSLVYRVEDQGSRSVPAANDAGTEKSYAVRYSAEGEPIFILLGMSGDDFFENTDPNAQALYLLLRRLFPGVTTYSFGMSGMGPMGFTPVSLADFIGLDTDAIRDAEIRCTYIDCEEGPVAQEMTEEDTAELMALLRSGKVTGKADALESTGGIFFFGFYAPDGRLIGSVDLDESGLLVMGDGRYYYQYDKAAN